MEAGTDHEGFKIPSTVPQDILLIQDLIGPIIPPTRQLTPDDSVDSSGESTDSAEEVEANLLFVGGKSTSEDVSDSTSESTSSSSSDSESESEEEVSKKFLKSKVVDGEGEDEDEEEAGGAAAATVRTKNEFSEPDIMIPPILQVGPDEQLERAGEIMNIVNNVVIVNGGGSGTHRASEHALDAETLLVYDDRKVLGYIHETFGPTYQPMYQVKFNSSFPLDESEARVSRPVFHVPARSKYVFVSELSRLRGSDASNVHDEEPAEYELEFSDDEAEAAHKAKLRGRRHGSREPSVPASPAHVRDQDLDASYGWNPYAEHGAYDMDLDYGSGEGPSRPKPQPYDDPYSDAYNRPDVVPDTSATSTSTLPSPRPERAPPRKAVGQSDHGSGQGQRTHHRHHHERGRGRGHGRGRGRGRGRGGAREGQMLQHHPEDRTATHSPTSPQSPTSTMMAPATGQYYGTPFSPQLPPQFGFVPPYSPVGQQQNQHQFISPQQQHSVQPHINPRFAATFGLNLDMMQHPPGQQYMAYGQYERPTTPVYEGGWDGQWNQGYSSSSGEHPHVKPEHGHDSSGT